MSPPVVRPRQTVHAEVTVHRPLDDVAGATVEWGYTNGGEWVPITTAGLDIATSGSAGATSTFDVPPGGPASSQEIAQWICRVRVSRRGRDISTEGEFEVVVCTADVAPVKAVVSRVDGAAETVVDVALPWAVFRAGDTIRGHIRLTPKRDLPDGDLSVCWRRDRLSHPAGRPPSTTVPLNGPIIKLGNRIPLHAGVAVAVPFELPLPADAAPTATAVHSSLVWLVAVRLRYAGAATRAERVTCPIVVVNA